jgi:polyisoprenoid-binding protein YceI
MKIIKQFQFLFASAFIFILCASTTYAPINKYILSEGYEVLIHGTSNLHNWNEKVQKVKGEGEINWNDDGSFDLSSINIIMDVHSIKGDMGSVMNKNTYKALKADKNPQITFLINTPIHTITANATENKVMAKGNLTIAGVTRPIEIEVKLTMQDKNKLIFEGSQIVKMSDFGIQPPTAFFGALKTGDKITISFKTGFNPVAPL